MNKLRRGLSWIIVIAASIVMIRLGLWQLDRLDQRRAINDQKLSQFKEEGLVLSSDSVSLDLESMEYRKVEVWGEFLFDQQVALKNQVWNNRIGVHLLTPLKIKGSDKLVLVDRGWIPIEDADPQNWSKYDVQGEKHVIGVIRASQEIPPLNVLPDPTLSPGQEKLDSWVMVNLERIDDQIPGLLDVFIQETFRDNQSYPLVQDIDREISEGPHLSYAIQWFLFAAMLLVGFPFYLKKQQVISDKI